MIAIVDYGMGNLASVYKAILYIGQNAMITSSPSDLIKADAVILPGVGAISDAMNNLTALKLDNTLKDIAAGGKPLLGICLGMQMLFETSEEGAHEMPVKGLEILQGTVTKFKENPAIKIPHMGWNKLEETKSDFLTEGSYVYFVHSYFAVPEETDIITSKSFHGTYFAASIEKGTICAMQFHPEKSGDTGLEILRRWIQIG